MAEGLRGFLSDDEKRPLSEEAADDVLDNLPVPPVVR